MKEKTLNIHQQIFLDEYLINGNNAAAAARKAYPKHKEENIQKAGSRLLKNPIIAAEVEKQREEIRKKSSISREEIIEELKTLMIEAKTEKDRTNFLKAIDTLNKMCGNYTTNSNIKLDSNIKLTFGGAGIEDETEEEEEDI